MMEVFKQRLLRAEGRGCLIFKLIKQVCSKPILNRAQNPLGQRFGVHANMTGNRPACHVAREEPSENMLVHLD